MAQQRLPSNPINQVSTAIVVTSIENMSVQIVVDHVHVLYECTNIKMSNVVLMKDEFKHYASFYPFILISKHSHSLTARIRQIPQPKGYGIIYYNALNILLTQHHSLCIVPQYHRNGIDSLTTILRPPLIKHVERPPLIKHVETYSN